MLEIITGRKKLKKGIKTLLEGNNNATIVCFEERQHKHLKFWKERAKNIEYVMLIRKYYF